MDWELGGGDNGEAACQVEVVWVGMSLGGFKVGLGLGYLMERKTWRDSKVVHCVKYMTVDEEDSKQR